MLSVDEARARILRAIEPVGTETVPLGRAASRVLAAGVAANLDLPAFDNSSVDGFAIRASDVTAASPDRPATLPVSADIPAGSSPSKSLEPGQAARIMTGAPLPSGADAVVMLEDTDVGLASAGGSAGSTPST